MFKIFLLIISSHTTMYFLLKFMYGNRIILYNNKSLEKTAFLIIYNATVYGLCAIREIQSVQECHYTQHTHIIVNSLFYNDIKQSNINMQAKISRGCQNFGQFVQPNLNRNQSTLGEFVSVLLYLRLNLYLSCFHRLSQFVKEVKFKKKKRPHNIYPFYLLT